MSATVGRYRGRTRGGARGARWLGALCAAGLAVATPGCQRAPTGEASPAPSGAAPSASVAGVARAAPSASQPGPAPGAEPAPAPADGPPPASFAGGAKVEITNAIGLGCQATTSEGWLELLCRKRNGTGGRPVRAVRDLTALAAAEAAGASPAPSAAPAASAAAAASTTETATDTVTDAGTLDPRLANVIEVDAQGELRVLAPWRSGQRAQIRLEWSDTQYDLTVDGESASLVLPVALGLRKQCEALRVASERAVEAAQKLPGEAALTSADQLKLHQLGLCQMAGLGAWAVGLDELTLSGSGAARTLAARLSVIHLDPDGSSKTAALGALEFAPGGLQLPPLMVYDYDDDGQDEVIIRHEVNKVAAGKAPAALPAVWSFKGGAVVAYGKLGPLGPGGVSTEHLDYDMRPDLADFGPFVAWLGPDCGARTCPPRLVGPRFFAHSAPDGSFSRTDAAAVAALERACAAAPASVVVADGQSVNALRTATLLGCARSWGVSTEVITQELDAKRGALCGAASDCSLLATLRAWASAEPPARVSRAARP
ncbi:MAG TPA: hypothetical protein PLU22_02830 [Polyangiaceae bacterium]|nr:hypothetical protein [Polyangiaceae bacterium]